jgi:predicted RNase H-like HicB family nuclease
MDKEKCIKVKAEKVGNFLFNDYFASIYKLEDNSYLGKIENINHTILFKGDTLEEVNKNGLIAVEKFEKEAKEKNIKIEIDDLVTFDCTIELSTYKDIFKLVKEYSDYMKSRKQPTDMEVGCMINALCKQTIKHINIDTINNEINFDKFKQENINLN